MKTQKIIYAIIFVFTLLLWQFSADRNSTVRLMISSPILSINYFIENNVELLIAAFITFIESITGLLLAIVFSFSIMILCFFSEKFLKFIMPIMIISQVIPLIVLAPFFIILFGSGLLSKILMSSLICFFPIFINFAQGYENIDKNIHEFLEINQASTWSRIRQAYFPLSLPNIFAGLKVSATLSVIGAIVGEFSGAEFGIGKNLFIAAMRLEPELMISSLFLSILIGFILFGCIVVLEKIYIKY